MYGNVPSRLMAVWNGILEHRGRMGEALWEFLWCLDRITKESDGIGLVFGGAPVKLERIVSDLNCDKETVRRHLKKLKEEKYIRLRRTPYGQVIEVLNSKKFGNWGKGKPQSAVSQTKRDDLNESQKLIYESEKPQSAVSKEDHAVDHAIDHAARAACPVWKQTGLDPQRLPGPFRKLCEDRWAIRNGASLFDFMGDVLDAWRVLEGAKCKYPPVWVRRKAEFGLSTPKQGAELPELEDLPWKK